MNEATGPTYSQAITQQTIEGANFVQEVLTIIGTDQTTPAESYSLLGYVPLSNRNVLIFKDGQLLLQTVDYQIDGRKIAFTEAFTDDGNGAATESCAAYYATTNEVGADQNDPITFDIPGSNVRLGVGGAMQILVEGVWYDMWPEVDPVTNAVTFVPDQDPSINQ
jgi:hypothetical protein